VHASDDLEPCRSLSTKCSCRTLAWIATFGDQKRETPIISRSALNCWLEKKDILSTFNTAPSQINLSRVASDYAAKDMFIQRGITKEET
jgi:hypothetical protein